MRSLPHHLILHRKKPELQPVSLARIDTGKMELLQAKGWNDKTLFYGMKWLAVFWMKQSQAGTGNLNQDLFFSLSCFWPYTASLTKRQVVMLHSNSELLFSLLYQHQLNIWRPREHPMCSYKAQCDAEALHCSCAEGEMWRWSLRRHRPSEEGKKGAAWNTPTSLQA